MHLGQTENFKEFLNNPQIMPKLINGYTALLNEGLLGWLAPHALYFMSNAV